MTRRALAALVCLGTPALSDAPRLSWPDQSTLTFEKSEPSARHEIATGPFAETGLPTRKVDGTRLVEVRRTPYPIEPIEVIASLKSQLASLGYVAGFDCDARGCGGFDFRYALDITPEPDMHVNLGKYHYLSLNSPSTGTHVTVLASTSSSEGFVEFIFLEEAGSRPTPPASQPDVVRDRKLPVTEQLLKYGSAALDDLEFASGSANLESDGAASLAELSNFLSANPDQTMVLVGHTDTAGSLEGNIALSLQRAASVREALINAHGVPSDRLRAEGIGYLAPRAANNTAEGQKRNRRVEAVLEAN